MSKSKFPQTSWTLLGDAASGERPALAELYRRYRPAVHAYIERERGALPGDASDLLHDFYLDKLPSVLAHADQARGSFRGYLLASIRNFLRERVRMSGRARRNERGIRPMVEEPAAGESPEDAFHRAWVRLVRERATRRLRAALEQRPVLDEISIHVLRLIEDDLQDGERGRYGSHGQLASKLGCDSARIKAIAYELRRAYHAIVREELAQTLLSGRSTKEDATQDGEELESEVRRVLHAETDRQPRHRSPR